MTDTCYTVVCDCGYCEGPYLSKKKTNKIADEHYKKNHVAFDESDCLTHVEELSDPQFIEMAQ